MSQKLIDELKSFMLQNKDTTLKVAACKNVADLTGQLTGIEFLLQHRSILEIILEFKKEQCDEAQSLLLTALVNISAIEISHEDIITSELLTDLVKTVCLFKESISDKCCMILNNISRSTKYCDALLQLEINLEEVNRKAIFCLIWAFCHTKSEASSLDYIASVLSNLSQTKNGRLYLLDSGNKNIEKILPFLKSNMPFTRRFGIASTIRNCLFEDGYHDQLLSNEIEILPALLLPIMDGTEYKDDENDSLPLDLQYLPADTQRDPSNQVTNIILECLLLLCATTNGRKFLKGNGVYYVLREYYNWANEKGDESITTQCEKVITILIGDEPEKGMENLLKVDIPENIQSKLNEESEVPN